MKRTVRKTTKFVVAGVVTLGLLSGYSYGVLQRPLPMLRPEATTKQITVQAPSGNIAWPKTGQSAVGIAGTNIVETNGDQVPAPTASTAKIITALTVLQKKPLAPGQQGPLITISPSDVEIYNQYLAADGSVVRVQAGEQISEYQMLQAILIPSANNIADSLAIWAYGSLDAYAEAANSYLTSLGLRNTHVGKDASGLDPTSASTAEDLVKLGSLVMQDPVLAPIVGQETATGLPLVGTVKNVNFLLGGHNVVGVKTGNSDHAGGVFVGAAQVKVNGQPVTVVTALVGAPNLFAAVMGSVPFIDSVQTNFKPTSIVKAGATVGEYHVPWQSNVAAVADSELIPSAWAGSKVTAKVNLRPLPIPAGADQNAGSMTAEKQSIPVKLRTEVPKPSIWWRLTHPLAS